MSTTPLALPGFAAPLFPAENPATLMGANTATLTPGLGSSNGASSLSDLQTAIEDQLFPGLATASGAYGAITGTGGPASGSASWFSTRGVVLILGLMLIAAGLFSLNPVKNTIVSAGRTAAAAAA